MKRPVKMWTLPELLAAYPEASDKSPMIELELNLAPGRQTERFPFDGLRVSKQLAVAVRDILGVAGLDLHSLGYRGNEPQVPSDTKVRLLAGLCLAFAYDHGLLSNLLAGEPQDVKIILTRLDRFTRVDYTVRAEKNPKDGALELRISKEE